MCIRDSLRAGALPAPLVILEERTVGPGLGADSVRAGKIASIIAFALVLVFMSLAYGIFGLVANVSLLTNLMLIGGALSALQALGYSILEARQALSVETEPELSIEERIRRALQRMGN